MESSSDEEWDVDEQDEVEVEVEMEAAEPSVDAPAAAAAASSIAAPHLRSSKAPKKNKPPVKEKNKPPAKEKKSPAEAKKKAAEEKAAAAKAAAEEKAAAEKAAAEKAAAKEKKSPAKDKSPAKEKSPKAAASTSAAPAASTEAAPADAAPASTALVLHTAAPAAGEQVVSNNLRPPNLGHNTKELPEEIAEDPESVAVWEAVTAMCKAKEDTRFAVKGYEGWRLLYKLRPEVAGSTKKVGDFYILSPDIQPERSIDQITMGGAGGNVNGGTNLTLRTLGQLIEVLLMRFAARQAGVPTFQPPPVGEIIEVEVEDEHCLEVASAEWRRGHVRRVLGDGRFCVCVHTPDDVPDEEFYEWYTRHSEGQEWRRLEGSPKMPKKPHHNSNGVLRLEYKGEKGEGGSKKGKKDPSAPKKAQSAFFIWMNSVGRDGIKEANPDLSGIGELGKLCGEKWRSMGESERAPWEEKAKEDKERHAREVAEAAGKEATADNADATDEAVGIFAAAAKVNCSWRSVPKEKQSGGGGSSGAAEKEGDKADKKRKNSPAASGTSTTAPKPPPAKAAKAAEPKAPDAAKSKKELSGYTLFVREQTARIQAERKASGASAEKQEPGWMMREVGPLWKALTSSARDEYNRRAKAMSDGDGEGGGAGGGAQAASKKTKREAFESEAESSPKPQEEPQPEVVVSRIHKPAVPPAPAAKKQKLAAATGASSSVPATITPPAAAAAPAPAPAAAAMTTPKTTTSTAIVPHQPSTVMNLSDVGMDGVAQLLHEFRLERYIEKFDEQGYDDLLDLLGMSEERMRQCVETVGMKSGHAQKFIEYLKAKQREAE